MPLNRYLTSSVFITGALTAIIAQVIAIFYLSPTEYGVFAVIYVCYALSVSSLYSVVIDPLVRSANQKQITQNSGIFWYSIAVFLLWLLISLTFSISPTFKILLSIGVALNVLRTGGRYWSSLRSSNKKTLFIDFIQIFMLIIVFMISTNLFMNDLEGLLLAWAVSGLISALLSFNVFDTSFLEFLAYLKTFKSQISLLWVESALLDVGSTITSLVLVPIMNIKEFGIYRGVLSTSVITRMFLSPARPIIASASQKKIRSTKILFYVLIGSFASGLIVSLTLYFAGKFFQSDSTFSLISKFWFESGCITFGVTISAFYYIIVRRYRTFGLLIMLRSIDTVLTFFFTVLGFIYIGINGAIVGAAISSLICASCWSIAGVSSSKGVVKVE